MNVRAIDPMGSARIDDVRDPYRVERVRAETYARVHAALRPQPTPKAVIAKHDTPSVPVNPLRDQYTAHCLKNAIQAFHAQQARLEALGLAVSRALQDEQTALQARADAANDLGTIQGLLPLQPYRFAVAMPQVIPQLMAAAADVGPLRVGPVNPAATSRGATDQASEPFRGARSVP